MTYRIKDPFTARPEIIEQLGEENQGSPVKVLPDDSVSFAGGSCKQLFCEENETCCVLADKLPCRHMNDARPSMSGFGIDVIQFMNTSRWPVVKTKQNKGGPEDSSWLAGLVLVA